MGQEIFKVIEWFMEQQTTKRPLLTKVDINLEVYLKILNGKMCLTSEIRSCFLGCTIVRPGLN
jgi:hypothetical protein